VHDPAYPAPAAEGFAGAPDGADVIRDPALLRRQFPWLTPHAVAVVHARRCGWLSAQQLGMLLLERARAAGTQLVRGRLTSVELTGGRVSSVTVQSAGATERFAAEVLINAAGPYASAVGRLAGLDLPVVCEGHVKIAFDDHLGAVPRDAPLLIWSDPVALPWSEAERDTLAGTGEGQPLLGTFPAGVHGRPEGAGRQVLLYWTYAREAREVPTYPLEWNPHYPEIALRGMSVMIPALAGYLERLPKPSIDGGYYAKTPDNRPLVGALAVPGAFALSALSGYGIMASLGAAEQLASLVVGDATAPWTSCFDPGRFDDPQYAASLADDTGQL
jgi:glycine/D-amino acid oxidase-like deaminating enzyme